MPAIESLANYSASSRQQFVGVKNGAIRMFHGLDIYNVKDNGAKCDNVTDDYNAIQSLVNQIVASGGGTLYFPFGQMCRVTQEITVPAIPNDGRGSIPIRFLGGTPQNILFGTVGAANLPTLGCILRSEATSGAAIRVLPLVDNFSMVRLITEDFEVRTYDNPTISGIDASYAQQFDCIRSHINTGRYTLGCVKPTHTSSAGIKTPLINNAAWTTCNDTVVTGFYDGIVVNEHFVAPHGVVTGCMNAMRFKTAYQSSAIGRWGLYRNNRNLVVDGYHAIEGAMFNIEHPNTSAGNSQVTDHTDLTIGNGYQAIDKDLYDPNNLLVGDFQWWTVLGAIGATNDFFKTGGTNLGLKFRQLGIDIR